MPENLRDRAAAAQAARQAATTNGGNTSAAGTEVAVPKIDAVKQIVDAVSPAIEAQLPRHIKPEAFLRVIITGLKNSKQAKALAECERPTLWAAMLEAARYGLMPFTDEGAIVPYGRTATFIPQYQGLIQIMYRTGQVANVTFNLIHQYDDWDIEYGTHARFYHKPRFVDADGNPADRGKPILAYCYVTLRDGSITAPTFVTKDAAIEVMQTRSRAWQNAEKSWYGKPPKKDSPWHTNFPEMWLKGLAVDTPIPTPAGWTTMGVLHTGDEVFDRDGQPVRVTAVSEVKHLDCYRVQFTSGPPIICDNEHRWVARIGWQHEKTHPIADLAAAKAAGQRVVIPRARALDLPAADLPIDPWTLGYYLGNGEVGTGRVTTHADDANEVITAILSAGYQTGVVQPYTTRKATRVPILGITKRLAGLGILTGKRVPASYLRGSAEQRLALLRGMMDSDGTTSSGRAKFGSTSLLLRDAVVELARSLGELVYVGEYDAHGFGLTVRCYEAMWTPRVAAPFTLSRKLAKSTLAVQEQAHPVKSIEPVASVPTRCIAVDSPTRTYLAGERMIPTHNTAVRQHSKAAPKSPELVELLLAEARDDTRRPDATPAPTWTPEGGEGRGIDWSTDDMNGAVPGEVIHDDEPVNEPAGQDEPSGDDDGWPDGARPPADVPLPGPGSPPSVTAQATAEPVPPADVSRETAGNSTVDSAAADEALARKQQEWATKLGTRFASFGDAWKGPESIPARLVVAGVLAAADKEPPLKLTNIRELDITRSARVYRRLQVIKDAAKAEQRDPGGDLQKLHDAAVQAREQQIRVHQGDGGVVAEAMGADDDSPA